MDRSGNQPPSRPRKIRAVASPGSDDGKPVTVQGGRRTKAIDLFIDRGLHELYDDVVNEAVPESLLRIIEDDRNK